MSINTGIEIQAQIKYFTPLQKIVVKKYATDPNSPWYQKGVTLRQLREDVMKNGGLYERYLSALGTIEGSTKDDLLSFKERACKLQETSALQKVFRSLQICEYSGGKFGWLWTALNVIFSRDISIFDCAIVKNTHLKALQGVNDSIQQYTQKIFDEHNERYKDRPDAIKIEKLSSNQYTLGSKEISLESQLVEKIFQDLADIEEIEEKEELARTEQDRILEKLKIKEAAQKRQRSVKRVLETQKKYSAMKIQCAWRRYHAAIVARVKEKQVLPQALAEDAAKLVEHPETLKKLERATSGRSHPYLPPDLPIVLKPINSAQAAGRYTQMQRARMICEQQHYSHLTIPSAKEVGDFLVETRLPIGSVDYKEQIGLYCEHKELFTEAVKEFTAFMCHNYLGDIVGQTNSRYRTFSRAPLGRYDNLPLYLEEEKGRLIGKIGLIDLEEFGRGKGEVSPDTNLTDVVLLFPHHLDTILEVAKRYKVRVDIIGLERTRDIVVDYFKKVYGDHLDLVKRKQISFKDPSQFDSLTRISEPVTKSLIKKCQEESKSWPYEKVLGENPKQTLKLFKKEIPIILDLINQWFSKTLKSNTTDYQKRQPIDSYPHLLKARSLFLSFDEQFELTEEICKRMSMFWFENDRDKTSFAKTILMTVVQSLADQKEIQLNQIDSYTNIFL